MTAWKRFESIANDHLGPEPEVTTRWSRPRAWRHGFAAQTVIENIEDRRSYRSFERAITVSFRPRSVIELELIHRLASLLWRLRRASAIETGLFEVQAKLQRGCQEGLPVASGASASRQIPFHVSAPEQIALKPNGGRRSSWPGITTHPGP